MGKKKGANKGEEAADTAGGDAPPAGGEALEGVSMGNDGDDDEPAKKKHVSKADRQAQKAAEAAAKQAAKEAKRNERGGGKDKDEQPAPAPSAAPDVAGDDEQGGEDDEEEDDDDGDVVTYPIIVQYCPICTLPLDMCEYSGMFDKCREWRMEHADEAQKVALAELEEKGRRRRGGGGGGDNEGGKGKKKKNVEKIVAIETKRRARRHVTNVFGLDFFGVVLKDFSLGCKKMYSCGGGVIEEEGKQPYVEVQGDFVSQIADMLPDKYNVPADILYRIEPDGDKVQIYPPMGEDAKVIRSNAAPKKDPADDVNPQFSADVMEDDLRAELLKNEGPKPIEGGGGRGSGGGRGRGGARGKRH